MRWKFVRTQKVMCQIIIKSTKRKNKNKNNSTKNLHLFPKSCHSMGTNITSTKQPNQLLPL